MSDDKKQAALTTTEEAADTETDERTVYLRGGRTLATRSEAGEEIVELRAASGTVELRVRVTDEGPVLSLEGVKLSLTAADSLELSCKTLRIAAEESVEVASGGELKLKSEKDTTVESPADVRLQAKTIWLN